jgi:uncharacterized protein
MRPLLCTLIAGTWAICIGLYLAGVTWPPALICSKVALLWLPGMVALLVCRREKLKLPIFAKPSRHFFSALIKALAIILLSLVFVVAWSLLTGWQVTERWGNSWSTQALLLGILFVGFLPWLLTFSFFIALGDELFWRGYLWEKLKARGFVSASTWIGLACSLWYLPLPLFLGNVYGFGTLASYVYTAICSFALSPILLLYRLRGESLMTTTFFHGVVSLFATAVALFFRSLIPAHSEAASVALPLALLPFSGHALITGRRLQQLCERGDSNPHEETPLPPQDSASTSSATFAWRANGNRESITRQ